MNCWRESSTPESEERASSPLIIFMLSGQMIMIGSLMEATLTSPVGNFASLLTFVSTTSTSASETSFFGKVNIGIPIGTNIAPLLADLFLHTFEYDFMLNTLKRDMTKAIQFSNTFRYIDDLLSVKNEEFENYISTIYPSELELKPGKLPHQHLKFVTTTQESSLVTTTHLSMSASTIKEMPLHFESSIFHIWTATSPVNRPMVFICLNW